MALLALHLCVLPGERIARLCVIERSRNIFPVREVVAGGACGTKAPAMRIVVASRARLGESDEASIQILDLDQRAFGRQHVLGRVALAAVHTRMFPFQRVSGQFMVKGFGVPLHEWEVEPVVIGVALRALLARSRPHPVGGMQSLASGQAVGDFDVAVQAFEDGLSAQLVAGGAAGRAFQIRMRASQRTGRNLSKRASRQKRDRRQYP